MDMEEMIVKVYSFINKQVSKFLQIKYPWILNFMGKYFKNCFDVLNDMEMSHSLRRSLASAIPYLLHYDVITGKSELSSSQTLS